MFEWSKEIISKIKESGCIDNNDDFLKVLIAIQSYDLQQTLTNPNMFNEDDIFELMRIEKLRLSNNRLNYERLRKELIQRYHENNESENSDQENEVLQKFIIY